MNVAKTLILKETNEWAVIREGELFTSPTPYLLPDTATKKGLERFYPYINFNELDLVTVEVNIAN